MDLQTTSKAWSIYQTCCILLKKCIKVFLAFCISFLFAPTLPGDFLKSFTARQERPWSNSFRDWIEERCTLFLPFLLDQAVILLSSSSLCEGISWLYTGRMCRTLRGHVYVLHEKEKSVTEASQLFVNGRSSFPFFSLCWEGQQAQLWLLRAMYCPTMPELLILLM